MLFMHKHTHSLQNTHFACMQTHTRYITAKAFVSICVSTIKAISATDNPAGCWYRQSFLVCRRACICGKSACDLYYCPCVHPLFSILSANLCEYLCERLCLWVRLCVRCFIKEHRSPRQCRGLWQRKQIFVPLPPTGNCSYTHRTPLSSRMLMHTGTYTLTGSVITLYRTIRRFFVQTKASVAFPDTHSCGKANKFLHLHTTFL